MTVVQHIPSATFVRPSDSPGSAGFQSKITAVRKRLAGELPSDLKLAPDILEDPSLSVLEVPETCGLLTKEEIRITRLDATGIRDAIAAGELTAVAAVTAFGRRAAIAQQLTGCLSEYFLDEGIARAKELDDHYARTGKVVGPMHGVPVSIKDHMAMRGHWASDGFLNSLHVAEQDCDLVATFRKQGAVFYVKTNQPQTLLHLESESFYGRVVSDPNVTIAGGSSGGEAAIVAMRGSPFGVGTDGGGSVRGPSAFSGIYGFKPTNKILPTDGMLWYNPGADSYGMSPGPMVPSLRDVDLWMKSVLDDLPSSYDPSLHPYKWTPTKSWPGPKLRVGIMRHDGVVLPQPPMLRAFDYAVEKLRRSGQVEIKDFKPLQHSLGLKTLMSLFLEDGGDSVRRCMQETGEEAWPLTEWFLSQEMVKRLTLEEGWALRATRAEWRKAYAAHWEQTGIDVLLLPPYPGTASRHDGARYWGYTAVYNILDYPAMVFPTGLKADPSIDLKQERDEFFEDMREADKYVHDSYDPAEYEGAPICLQLAARRWEDNMLYEAYKIVVDIVQS